MAHLLNGGGFPLPFEGIPSAFAATNNLTTVGSESFPPIVWSNIPL